MRAIVLLILVCLVSCAKDLTGIEPTTDDHNLAGPKIIYLGVGGWLLDWKKEGLLFAPSFTNPGFPPIFVRSNPDRITPFMPDAPEVRVLLVGHGHYDHLLDVPDIMRKQAPKAKAYGNSIVGRMLSVDGLEDRFVDVEQNRVRVHCRTAVCYWGKQSQWTRVGHIRFMAIESQHAPHVAGINLLEGGVEREFDELPTYVRDWKQGTTLAFLVDLLDDDRKRGENAETDCRQVQPHPDGDAISFE